MDPNIKVNLLTGSKKNQFADILVNLEDVRLGNRLLVQEVLPYIRVSKSEVELHCDRIDVKTLELSPLAEKCLALAKAYPQIQSFLYSLYLLFGRGAQREKFKKELTQGGSWIVLSMIRRDQSSYVSLGQLLQKILNYLTAQHIASYTMVSGLYLLDLLRENLEIYSESEQLRLLRHQYDLQSFFQFADQRIALIIRVGYADEPRYRSLRKSVASLMVHEMGNRINRK